MCSGVEFRGEVLPHFDVLAGELRDGRDAVRRYGRRHVGQLLGADGVDVEQAQYALSAFVVAQGRVAHQLFYGGGRASGGHGLGVWRKGGASARSGVSLNSGGI
jgi:hypothetical protein